MIELPEILNIPQKLLPIILQFNTFRFFLIEGGRGSGKSQSIARLILWLCEMKKIRVVCGRELQVTITESVKTILADLIIQYNLNFDIGDKKITHRETGSTIIFKGFREQGKVNIKGLEGVDILWVDEAESIQKTTLEIIVPTIRKQNSKILFTMNRYVRNDAVYTQFVQDEDCCHIHIDYFENPFCTKELIREAEKCKKRNIKEYNHIWLGQPLDQTNDYLISASKLDLAQKIKINVDNYINKHKVLSVDVAGSGGDLNVVQIVEQKNSTTWENIKTFTWSEPDTDITIGKIINLYSTYKPDITIIDADGVGYAIANAVFKTIKNGVAFRGAGKVKIPKSNALNARAEGYLDLKEFLNNEWLKLNDEETIRQLEYIKVVYKSSGLIQIQSKDEIRKAQGESPDYADSLMMNIYAIKHYSYMFHNSNNNNDFGTVDTDFNPYE